MEDTESTEGGSGLGAAAEDGATSDSSELHENAEPFLNEKAARAAEMGR